MGFEFKKRPVLEVCGKQYEVDSTDVGFVEAVVTDFAGITREYDSLLVLRRELGDGTAPEEEAPALAERFAASNRRIFENGLRFIENVLGKEAREEIFAGRRANSAEVVELCAYLYQTAIESRKEVVSRYVLPESNEQFLGGQIANRNERRSTARAAKRRRKITDD